MIIPADQPNNLGGENAVVILGSRKWGDVPVDKRSADYIICEQSNAKQGTNIHIHQW